MPYIKKEDKQKYEKVLSPMMFIPIETPGELNFLVTYLCNMYRGAHGNSYKIYNDIIGVLECAKLEMYRRKVSGYEDAKIVENGDVYN